MAKQKRRSTAAKQRAKARRQQRAAAGERGPEPASPPAATARAAAPARAAATARPARRPQARQPSARRRRSRRTSWAAIGAVLAVVAIFVVMSLTGRKDDTSRGKASPGSIEKLTSIPAATLEAVGAPRLTNVNALPAGTPPIEQDGKPVVLYYGAEYCPFCALERWPVVIALSRFGTFEGLSSTTSAPPPETLPNTPTVTFHGSTYTSDYVVFSAVETQTRDFTPLETPTPLQQRLFDTYNVERVTGSSGAIPFVMIGNRYAWAGAQYDAGVLEGKSFDEIVAALQDPSTEIAKQIDGTANVITAMICELTGGQPSQVCSSPVIAEAQAALPKA
jgi:thiol-disulfide isomerase/thioredoxin